MKKIVALLIALIMCFSLAACSDVSTSGYTEPTDNRSNYEQQAQANEESAKNITQEYGTVSLSRSQDYENIMRRAEYLNQANNVGYLYLLTETGALVRESQVLGKVTSLNSYITPMEEIVKVAEGSHRYESWGYPDEFVVVQAPDLDGTYGENVNGIFWFTPDGVYQEWVGLYLFSSERLTFTDTAVLVESK